MPAGETGTFRDRGAEVEERLDATIRDDLRRLVTARVIEEHRRRPTGRHSPALAQVLAFLRQRPIEGKLAVLATLPGQQWLIIRLSGVPGVPHQPVDGGPYRSEGEALHAVFLRRLADMGVEVDIV